VDRIKIAADRSGVNMTEWLRVAVEIQVEADEAAAIHVPPQVRESLPRYRNGRIIMPRGRVTSGRV
jgi:hypothetical protein